MLDMINLLQTNKEWLFSGFGGAFVLAFLGFLFWIVRTIYHWLHKQNNTEPKQLQITGDNCTNFQSGGNLTIDNSHFGDKRNVK